MPHNPNDALHPHLLLVAGNIVHERRRKPAPPAPPPRRGGRRIFANQLQTTLDRLEQEAAAVREFAGIQPHLVFRMPLAAGAVVEDMTDRLRELGLTPVSIEPDRAVIAFRETTQLDEFKQAVERYRQGPRINSRTGERFKSTKWDVFEYLETEDMRLWDRTDRIGVRLRASIGHDGENIVPERLYVVDLELWHKGTRDLATAAVQEVRAVIGENPMEGERVLDNFIGDAICLVRVATVGETLNALLDLPIVAEIDLPPEPEFVPARAFRVTARDFPQPPRPDADGPRVCVLDSGVAANHPLLANNYGHGEAILTADTTAADVHGHGTLVGGLAVFGNVRACYESGRFSSPITLFNARVLNDQNRFDDEK